MTGQKLGFAIVGAQKAGTGTLDHLCRTHPQIRMARVKETHFFDDEALDWSRPDYAALDAQYPEDESRVRGESTPITMFWRPAVDRMHRYNPDIRIVALLRDPVERAYSHWRHEIGGGREALPFAAAIREGRRRLDGLPPTAPEHRVFSYVERGLYARQLRHMLERFPGANVHVEVFEEFVADQPAGLQRLAGFLNLDPFPPLAAPAHKHRLEGKVEVPPAAAEDMELLTEAFRDDVVEVEQMLKRSMPWRSSPSVVNLKFAR